MELREIPFKGPETEEIYSSSSARELIKMYADFYPKVGFTPPWVGYFAIKNNQVVGSGSFVGKPQDRKVEISYWTFKEFEGQGIASAICEQLISIAYEADPDIIITAKTEPRNNASTRILEKHGFIQTGIVNDDEIGDAWLWVHQNNLTKDITILA